MLCSTMRSTLGFSRPIDVAIDVHNWLYYGDSETPHVSQTDPDRGTDCAYKFATICIVDPSVRFTPGWVPLDGDKTDELAELNFERAASGLNHEVVPDLVISPTGTSGFIHLRSL